MEMLITSSTNYQQLQQHNNIAINSRRHRTYNANDLDPRFPAVSQICNFTASASAPAPPVNMCDFASTPMVATCAFSHLSLRNRWTKQDLPTPLGPTTAHLTISCGCSKFFELIASDCGKDYRTWGGGGRAKTRRSRISEWFDQTEKKKPMIK